MGFARALPILRACSPDGAKRNPGGVAGVQAAPGLRYAPSGLRSLMWIGNVTAGVAKELYSHRD
jgi:hypothetical protein